MRAKLPLSVSQQIHRVHEVLPWRVQRVLVVKLEAASPDVFRHR
jgi:hypothetical protein